MVDEYVDKQIKSLEKIKKGDVLQRNALREDYDHHNKNKKNRKPRKKPLTPQMRESLDLDNKFLNIKRKNPSITETELVVELFKMFNNKPMHYIEIADKTRLIQKRVKRITEKNIEGNSLKPIFERVETGVYKLIENQHIESIRSLIHEFSKIYTIDVDNPDRLKSQKILKKIENIISNHVNPKYVIKGSTGMGTPTPTPWIGIRDKRFTNNFMKGMYIFYSFPEDMDTLYLAIGQGTDSLKKEVGTAAARLQLTSNAASLRHIFKEEIKEGKYLKSIDLKSKQKRASSYQDSVVVAKKYNINRLPKDDIILNDLQNLLDLYPKMVKAINIYSSKIKIDTTREVLVEKISENVAYEYDLEVDSSLNLDQIDINTEDSEVAAKNAYRRILRENKLDKRFIKFMSEHNLNAFHTRSVDIVVETKSEKWLIESKILKTQTTAAHAMGQVMFYNFRDSSENNKIALLFDKKPNKSTCEFLDENLIPYIWEVGDSFKFNGDIGELPL